MNEKQVQKLISSLETTWSNIQPYISIEEKYLIMKWLHKRAKRRVFLNNYITIPWSNLKIYKSTQLIRFYRWTIKKLERFQ